MEKKKGKLYLSPTGNIEKWKPFEKRGQKCSFNSFSTERVQGILEDFILLNQIDRVLFKKKKK